MLDPTSFQILVGSFGFPIAVCIYLLYERRQLTSDLSNSISEMTNAINSLKIEIVKLNERFPREDAR